jgi:hypothetical protein
LLGPDGQTLDPAAFGNEPGSVYCRCYRDATSLLGRLTLQCIFVTSALATRCVAAVAAVPDLDLANIWGVTGS